MNQPLYDREGMAKIIRQQYIEHRRKATGRKYTPNQRHDHPENWLQAADACIANQADPFEWVAASFVMAKSAVFANQLGGPAALSRWKEYTRGRKAAQNANNSTTASATAELASLHAPEPEAAPQLCAAHGDSTIVEDTAAEIEAVIHDFRTQSKDPHPRANRDLMLNRFFDVRPHVRVAIAGRYGLHDVVAKFRSEAADFLAIRPAHAQALRYLGFDMEKYLNDAR